MNIIICGTGQVGTSIAGRMAIENDVTIIDSNAERVQRAADTHNLRGVIGVSSHPDILEEAVLLSVCDYHPRIDQGLHLFLIYYFLPTQAVIQSRVYARLPQQN